MTKLTKTQRHSESYKSITCLYCKTQRYIIRYIYDSLCSVDCRRRYNNIHKPNNYFNLWRRKK